MAAPVPFSRQEPDPSFAEKHYLVEELTSLWGISAKVLRPIFENEQGVIRFGSRVSGKRRRYLSLRVPLSVAERIHARLCRGDSRKP